MGGDWSANASWWNGEQVCGRVAWIALGMNKASKAGLPEVAVEATVTILLSVAGI